VKIAVLGASGVVGRALLPLLSGEHEVVAVSRHGSDRRGDGVRWVAADITERDGLDDLLHGVDVVYHLVHSLGTKDFAGRDRRAADAVAEASERAGVRQIVFLGGLGDASQDGSLHLRSRAETAERLASRSVPLTTLRSAIVVGEGSAAFETIVGLVDRLPVMVCPRWVRTRTQPIALQDVARYLAGVAGHAGALGRTFDVAGPEVMTCRDMILRVGDLRGRRPLIVEVPVLTPRLSSAWLHLVTPVQAGVARELVDGLRTETVAREDDIATLVPLEPTPFDEAARRALRARDAA
jgi:uncharacterized protein YbjT (DUF2867 family)